MSNFCQECGKPANQYCNHCINMQIGENHATIHRINLHIKELQGKCQHKFSVEPSRGDNWTYYKC